MVSDPGPGGHPQGAGAGSVASCSIPVLQGGFMESVCLPAGTEVDFIYSSSTDAARLTSV